MKIYPTSGDGDRLNLQRRKRHPNIFNNLLRPKFWAPSNPPSRRAAVRGRSRSVAVGRVKREPDNLEKYHFPCSPPPFCPEGRGMDRRTAQQGALRTETHSSVVVRIISAVKIIVAVDFGGIIVPNECKKLWLIWRFKLFLG